MVSGFLSCFELKLALAELRRATGSLEAVLESPLFYLCLEDNNWSLAVELIQKEPPQGRSYAALQARCYQRYLTGIARCLLNHLPTIGLYAGPWTSGRLRREELSA